MDTREKLNEFAELQGWNKNKLIGWSEAADFGQWLVKNCSIPAVIPSCEGKCGMNYCDDNGCIERKRILVEPTDLPEHEA